MNEFRRLEEKFPFLRHARERFWGLRGLACAVIDIETTGLEPEPNEIIEIAALKVEQGEIADVFNSLIRIGKPLPAEIIRLTGITDEMLAEGEGKTEVFSRLLAFVGQLPLVAHNAEFDIPFLKHHLNKTMGAALPNQPICTLKLSRRLVPGLPSYRLQKLAEYFAIPAPLLHRAPGDVEITFKLWQELAGRLEKRGVTTLEQLLSFA
ncbi:MAG: 3'-5' exonuclease [Candidatus Saganbacteria bacterium]|nr:3'-5' exonuclease [Candidatus Saganbacteria bacterium]